MKTLLLINAVLEIIASLSFVFWCFSKEETKMGKVSFHFFKYSLALLYINLLITALYSYSITP